MTRLMSDVNLWAQILERLRPRVDPEDFRRWLSQTSYASDSGDQVTVWVASESVRRHIEINYFDAIDRALEDCNRFGTRIRFVVTGYEEEDERE